VQAAPGLWRTNLRQYDLSVRARNDRGRVGIEPDSPPLFTVPG